MTFWIDAQLDPELAAWIGATFKVLAKAIKEVGLRDEKDQPLFDAAKRFGDVVIVTKDKDFAELVNRIGPPPQILWLRFRNMSTIKMRSLLSMTFPEALRLLEAGAALVEITEAGECRICD